MKGTLAILLLAFASSADAQIFMMEPVSSSRGAWMLDIGGQMAQPVGAFGTNVNRAWGVGIAGRHHFRFFRPLGVRADVSFLNYGNERKSVPLSPTVNRVIVDMRTTNNIVALSGGPELMLMHGPLRPYVYAFAGYSHFYTESSAGDDDGADTFASTTNFWDGGLATGWGGGVRIPFNSRSVNAAFDAGVRYTHNGTRSYLVAGDITDRSRTVGSYWPNSLPTTGNSKL